MILYENGATKQTYSGTYPTLDNTIEAPLQFDLFGNTSQDTIVLPSEYQQVEYIQSSGTQYIDTGVQPCMNKIRCVCDMIPLTTSDTAFFGSRGTYYLFYNIGNNYFWPVSKCETIEGTLSVGNKYHIDWNKGTFEITGTDGVYEKGVRSNNTQDTRNMYIFNFNPKDNRGASAKLYNFKIYVQDVLTRDFIPCYRISDNEVGLYDLVSNTFFTNIGTGTFDKGSNITPPSPTYPQEVKVVSGNNTIKVGSKNLYDGVFRQGGSLNTTTTNRLFTQNDFEIKGGIPYTISTTMDLTTYRYAINMSKQQFPVGAFSNIFYDSGWKTSTSFTFTPSQDGHIGIIISKQNGDDLIPSDIESALWQLEKGSKATEYVAYQTQSYSVDLGSNELCKINDYKDSIFYNTTDTNLDLNAWYIKKEIGKIVLNGTETNWNRTTGTGYYAYWFRNTSMGALTQKHLKYCDRFIYSSTGYTTADIPTLCENDATSNPDNFMFIFKTDGTQGTTVNDWKTWLSNNNTIVYYILSTPTYTKITDETLIGQIEALQEATSYREITNINQINNDLPFNLDVSAYVNPLDLEKNGLGYLPNVLSAYVIDAINGEYSLTFEYPMNDLMSDEIKEGRIVKCKVADGSNQCFVIKNIEKTYEKMVVKCTHLFYMLLEDFIDDSYPQNLSPKPFLDWLLHRMNYPLPFTTTSDVATIKSGRYVRRNMVDIILGDSNNSMINLFGIELERNNWNIGLKARIGADHGEKLIYGKNINGINVSIDDTGVYTRIMPIGFDGLLLPERYVDAPNINQYPYPRICLYSFPNIKYDPNDESAYHTEEEAYQALRDATNELYTNKINYPKININIDWLELSKTEEYKQYSALERVHLGDTITSNIFGMDYETRVIQTTYNPLNDRVEGFEIGTFQPTFTSYTTKLSEQVKEVNPDSILAEAQANATNLINSAMGGYVYKTNSELYIMDTDDPSTAQKVWRWNINGLGYSSTGVAGPYGLAMTMDGQIVADFITTGQLTTSVISGYDSITQQVYDTTNNLDNVNSDLQQYKTQVASQFTQTASDFNFQFNSVNQLINDVSNTTSNNFEEIHKYIRFVDGKIILGEEGNAFTAELSNNELSFLQNGTKIAYVSNNKLYITNAEILTNVIIGNFQFTPRNNGSLSFRKVG